MVRPMRNDCPHGNPEYLREEYKKTFMIYVLMFVFYGCITE